MTEYGIFSESAGGCIYAPCYSPQEADRERERLITEDGEESDDLTVRELCPEHEEQPKDGCEECFDECDEDEAESDTGFLVDPHTWIRRSYNRNPAN